MKPNIDSELIKKNVEERRFKKDLRRMSNIIQHFSRLRKSERNWVISRLISINTKSKCS
jgi:hypothetical protein